MAKLVTIFAIVGSMAWGAARAIPDAQQAESLYTQRVEAAWMTR